MKIQDATNRMEDLSTKLTASENDEAVINFRRDGVDFSLSVSESWMILWFDDEAQNTTLFFNDPDDIIPAAEWLMDGVNSQM